MQIKDRQKLLLILALSAVGLFAADQVLLTPLTKTWKAREERIAKLRLDVKNGKTLRLRELSIRNYWRDISSRSLTNDLSTAELQVNQAIDRWAQTTGVILGGINPQWKENDEYRSYECHVDVTGDLGRLTHFLYSAEREALALKLQAIELNAKDKEGRQLALSLQISGLMLNPEGK